MFFLIANVTYFSMSPRIISFANLLEPGGILIFPFTFFFSDIITEVYGYKQARQLIWISVLCLTFFVVASNLCLNIPSAPIEHDGNAFQIVFGKYPQAFLATGTATVISFLTNNYILAKLKILARGRYYWLRSIFSTSIGHAIFSLTWAAIFYHDVMSISEIIKIAFNIYGLKILSEILLTPFSAIIAAWIKLQEGVDVYDYDTKFTFFSLKVN
jgi:uncharacterized integral membrane protein (TIGR00697 family)